MRALHGVKPNKKKTVVSLIIFLRKGKQTWKANTNLQPVFNPYEAVTYMCAYFSKSDDETSEAMKQAAREALNRNERDYKKIIVIAKAYITKRECSVQETAFLVMPEFCLHKIFL